MSEFPKLKVKRSEVVNIFNALTRLKSLPAVTPKVTHAVARCLRLLRDENESILDALKPPEAFYEKQSSLYPKYAKKNDKGQPIVENGKFIIGDETGLNAELTAVREEFDIAWLERRNKTFMAEETEISFYPLPIAADASPWTADVIEALLPLMQEPADEDAPAPVPAVPPAPLALVPKP